MVSIRRLFSTQQWLTLIFLSAAGILGNYFSVPVFQNMEFFFGSTASLLALFILGLRPALFVSLVSGIYFSIYWGHPIGLLIGLMETLVIGLLTRRLRFNLLLASACFWSLIGLPLLIAAYHYYLAMSLGGTQLLALKQAVNGLLNATIASILFSFVPAIRNWGRREKLRLGVAEACFTLLATLVLIPLLFQNIWNAEGTTQKIRGDIKTNLISTTNAIDTHLTAWRDKHFAALSSLARVAERVGVAYTPELETDLAVANEMIPEVRAAYIADADANVVAIDPPVNRRGESTRGRNFGARAYFQDLKRTMKPVFSDVFMGTLQLPPYITISWPIQNSGIFLGYACFVVEFEKLNETLFKFVSRLGYHAVILDAKERVITSTNPHERPGDTLEYLSHGRLTKQPDGTFQWSPSTPGTTFFSSWEKSVLGRRVALSGIPGWSVIIEAPYAPHQTFLQETYTRAFALMFGLSCVALLGASLISRLITQSLLKLTDVTARFDELVSGDNGLPWPSSDLAEVNLLIANFRHAKDTLRTKFLENEQTQKELARAKQIAEDSNQAKSYFLANMSHEIRTPLGAILGSADLMMNAPDGDPSECLEAIKRNGAQLSRLIDDILDLSKIEASRIDFESSEFPLVDLVRDGIYLLRHLAIDKGISLEVKQDGPLPLMITSDITRIKQILINIIGNAIKFTARGGVTVTLSYLPGEVDRLAFRVRDTGLGISSEQKERLFQPFMQADASTSRRFGGTGLGLVLAKRLAEALQGDVVIEASELGQGSTFLITIGVGSMTGIPFTNSLEDALEAANRMNMEREKTRRSRPQNEYLALAGRNVLVVDDAPDNRWLLTRMLKMAGLEVDTLESGYEALERLKSAAYDIVLMDIQMPGIDGYETCRRLREQGYRKPLIALTAHAMKEDREKSFAAGFDDHIAKPINREQLLETIVRLTEGRRIAPQSELPHHQV